MVLKERRRLTVSEGNSGGKRSSVMGEVDESESRFERWSVIGSSLRCRVIVVAEHRLSGRFIRSRHIGEMAR